MKDIYLEHHPALKHTRAYFPGSDVKAPDVNYTRQLMQTLKGYQNTAPGFYNLNQTYAPKYTDLNNQQLAQSLFGSTAAPGEVDISNEKLLQSLFGTPAAPGQLDISHAAATSNRGADIGDIQRFGRTGYEALLASNPGLAQSLGQANAAGTAANAPGSLLSTMRNHALDDPAAPILGQLNTAAQQALARGGDLSPQEQRAIDEQTRSAFSDRGMALGNPAIGTELLNRDAARRQRLQAAQQFASGVQGLDQANINQRQGFALGVGGLDAQNRSLLGNLSSLNASIYDPSQQVIGRGGTSLAGLGGGGGIGSLANGSSSSLGSGLMLGNLFSPNAGADSYFTGVNAQGAANIANANNSAARNNAYVGAGASVLGALLSDERLKKNVKATGRKTADEIPEKEWTYRTDPHQRRWRGVMAQDVEKVRPDAVLTDEVSGVKAVDYAKLGTGMSLLSKLEKAA